MRYLLNHGTTVHCVKYINISIRAACNKELCLWETRGQGNCPWIYSNENNICGVGVRLSTPCYGDSGGPLIKVGTNIQVGIVSWGIYCINYLPTVFTNVGVYHDWIQNKLDLY